MNWIGGGDMNQARLAPQMVVLGNKVLALGGKNAENKLSTIEELKEDLTWSTSPLKMMEARAHFAAVVVPKKMLSP